MSRVGPSGGAVEPVGQLAVGEAAEGEGGDGQHPQHGGHHDRLPAVVGGRRGRCRGRPAGTGGWRSAAVSRAATSPATRTVQPTADGHVRGVAARRRARRPAAPTPWRRSRTAAGGRPGRRAPRPIVHMASGTRLPSAAHAGHRGERVGAGGVDDDAGGEEEQGLEGTVREEVEDGGVAVADGQGAGHVAELADGRVGQHALDVVLREGGQAGADHRHGGHRGRARRGRRPTR